MALHFDYSAPKDRGEPIIWTDDKGVARLCGWLDSLVWSTLILGCQVDDPKFPARLRSYEIANGAVCNPPRDEHRAEALARGVIQEDTFTADGYISLASIKRASGLKTNVTKETDAQWAKKLHRIVAEDAERSLRREGGK